MKTLVTIQHNRRAKVEQQACWVMTGCGREPGGVHAAESGPCLVATAPSVKRPRLPYPVCPAMESGNGDAVRTVVRQLIDGAL